MADANVRDKVDPSQIPFPEHLRIAKPPYRPGVMRVPVDRFYKQEYHDLEVERIWKRSWQWACRVEEIPEIGDFQIYEIAELSFIVIRTGANSFKAYWNSCPHRARRIRDCDGKRATELRCMFHGWAWSIDGKIKDMMFGEDFPGTGREVSRLREAKVGVWAGFIMINPDLDAEPLEDFIGELPDHFEAIGCDFGARWKQVHVQAELECNWKVAQEAFLEPWHATTTHPQLIGLPMEGHPAGERWDDFGNWMRNAPAFPGDPVPPTRGWSTPAENEQQFIDGHYDYHLNEECPVKVEEGISPAETVMRNAREEYRAVMGDKIDEYHDFHFSGYEMVSLWPNMHPWGGFSRLIYRFRPLGSNPERCIMDILLMSPWPEDKPMPAPATIHRLGPDEPITNAVELGFIARIFVQDLGNLRAVQAGLKSSPHRYVILGSHNDAPVRHFHDLYDKWMGLEEGSFDERGVK